MKGLGDFIKERPELALAAILGLWLAYTKLVKATTLRGPAEVQAIEDFTDAYATAHGY